MAQHVSMARYEAATAAASRARKSLSAAGKGMAGMKVPGIVFGGAVAAGAIDSVGGEGTASIPALILFALGWWFKYPTVSALGLGLATPFGYRLGGKIGGNLPKLGSTGSNAPASGGDGGS